MTAADARPERCNRAPRPYEDEASWANLVPCAEWHRCADCGATFAAREGLRGHHRFNRCPNRKDANGEGRVVDGRGSLP